MNFLNTNHRALCIVWVIIGFTIFGQSWASSPEVGSELREFQFHRVFSGVYFDVVDFLVNNALPIALDESGLTTLLMRIHTRFDTIMVSVNVPQRKVGNFSNDQLPEAVAKLNLLLNSSQHLSSHIKVDILVKVEGWGNEQMVELGFQEIQKVINRTNSIFPGTVNNVVLEMTDFTDETRINYLKFRNIFINSAVVGMKVNLKMTIDTISNKFSTFWKLKNGVLNSTEILYVSEDFNKLAGRVPVTDAVSILETQFRNCKTLVKNLNNSTDLALVTTWTDTNETGHTNYTEFVAFWEGISDWAAKYKTYTIFLQAFDTPLKIGSWTSKTNGWWRIRPNSSNLFLSEFVFEEKLSLTEEKSGAANMTWLSQPTEFSRAVVGVHFRPFALKSKIGSSDLDFEASIPLLIQQTSTKFSKVVISTLREDKEPHFNPKVNNIYSVPGAIARWNANGSKIADKLMELMMTFDENTAQNVSRSAREANLHFEGTVSQLIYSPTKLDADILLDGFVAMASEEMKNFSFGIKLDAEVCIEQTRFLVVMNLLQEDFFSDIKIKVLYFAANVSIENSILGFNRFLPLLTAMFENCRKKVDQYFLSHRGHAEVAFMTGWPITNDENFEELVQFISFWEGINAWATSMNTTVILSSAFDPVSSGMDPTQPGTKEKYGWWRVKEISTAAGLPVFENKKEVAFRHAKKKLDEIGSGGSSKLAIVIITSVSAIIAILIVALLTVLYLLKRRQSDSLTKEEIDQFFNGGDSTSFMGSPEGVSGAYQKSDLELSGESFTIDESSSLGSGEYGKVCLGSVTRAGLVEEVAVKMTKVPTKAFALRGLMFEIKILSYLGKHPHIVGLVGAYTAELNKNVIFVFLELCGLGSLQRYLKEYRASKKQMLLAQETKSSEDTVDQIDYRTGHYIGLTDFEDEEKTELDVTLINNMAEWSREIASGMEFIASKHIVHLDLATRNVLLTLEKRAKITDFGLSRRMYDYHSYIKTHQEPLPWVSMAPESLKSSEFTEKSDVWAFGILLWEIYSLGDEPYPGICWDVSFPTKLEQGLRPSEPTFNQNEVYSIMRLCWNIIPERRPAFSTLINLLETLFGTSLPIASEIDEEAPVTNNANNGIILPELDRDCSDTKSNCGTVSQQINSKQEKICPAEGRMRSSLFVILLFIIIVLPIWLLLGTGVQDKSSGDMGMETSRSPNVCDWNLTRNTIKNQCVSTTESPGEPGNEYRNRTSLGHKLFIAILGNGRKEDTVKALVLLGADVNVINNLGRTPLISAGNCSNDRTVCLKIVEFLIENRANVTLKDKWGNTFIHHLVEYKSDQYGRSGTVATPLQFHQITAYLVSKNMSKLLNVGRDGDIISRTPLELAIRNIEVENRTLLLLYNNEVSFNETMRRPDTMEMAVMGRRSPQLLSALIEFGANWRFMNHNRIVRYSLLHFTASICYSEGVEFFLTKSFEIDATNEYGETPLHLAVECDVGNIGNVLETARVLIESGANVSIRTKDGRTPLTIVLYSGDFPDKVAVEKLLRDADSSFNPANLTQEEKNQQLFEAIDQQNEDTVKVLIRVGADVNATRTQSCITPLMRAADRMKCGHSDNSITYRIVKLLINNGANVYAQDPQFGNLTFMHRLVRCGSLTPYQFSDIAHLLISKNFTRLFNLRIHLDYETVLQKAILYIQVEIRTLNFLRDNGVDFKYKDTGGQSTLYYAVYGARGVELLSELVEFGVDWKSINDRNQSLLHIAAGKQDYIEGVKFFVNMGLDVNAQDKKGFTALHHAVYRVWAGPNILEVVQVLIENGANVKIKNKAGATPHSIALKNNLGQRVIQLLQIVD